MKISRCAVSVRGFHRAVGLSLALWWLVSCGSLFAAGGADCDLPRVERGLEYLHHRVGDGPWSIHVVKVDRSGSRFQLVSTLAQDHVHGLAPVSRQAAALRLDRARPVAAVDGDFFVIRSGPYQGDPRGLHIVGGEIVSAPAGTSFWIDREGRPHIDRVIAGFRATGPNGLDIAFDLNRERGEDKAVLYTPAVGVSTRTGPGLELILEKAGNGDWLPLRPGGSYQAKVAAVAEQGDVELAPQMMVLSIGPALASELPAIAPGATITLGLTTTPDLKGAVTAVGGGPILLENGKPPEWSPPLPRHPRTALGWNEEHFILAVVDGRQADLSAGMTYPELASLMKRLGCTYAMNLDGGGSSMLWLDGHIMNSPSDGRERPVANSLVVVSTDSNEAQEDLQDQ